MCRTLQTLRLIKHLCNKGAHDFRRAMARQSTCVRCAGTCISLPYALQAFCIPLAGVARKVVLHPDPMQCAVQL